ncbi:segmentation protein cap'n'collar-like [Limulus polyphemus]|uniref:Segmentation protein cap'n'collar-like n=1 Tax=Limulus polyphemus TaxID=6850 RepID=A0ABM1BV22_LIMPO|nr:segmentation protein cap'n'collar-like [Limulus polyphemus]
MAVSLAALANGTDPATEGMMNVMYDQDFQEFVYGSNTSAAVPPALQLPGTRTSLTLDQLNTPTQLPASNQEYLLPELLVDNALHVMDVSDNAEDSNPFPSHLNMQFGCVEKRVESSSDSAVPSLGPDRIHSLSKAEWVDTCSETSSHQGDYENSVYSVEQNIHSCHMVSEVERSHVTPQYMGNQHPLLAEKKSRLFGRRPLNYQCVTSQEGFVEAEQLTQPVLDPHYFNIQDQGDNYLSNTFVHQNLESSPTLGNENYCGGVLASGSSALYIDSFLQDNYFPLSIDGAHSFQKNSTRKSNELSKTESDNRDDKLAKALNLPLSNEDIIVLPIDEFNEKLSKYELTESQLSLIRDIRRRGKNKVAAQNCRKRKLDQIVGLTKELEMLQSDKKILYSEQERLLTYRNHLQEKYKQLYQVVLQNTQRHLAASLYTPDHSQVVIDSGVKSGVDVQRLMGKMPAD